MNLKFSLLFLISFWTINGICQEQKTLYNDNGLVITTTRATYKNKLLYDAEKDLEELTKREKTADCNVSYQFYYNPLSLVGHFYSYEFGEGGILACGTPGNSLGIQTIDLNTNKPVALTDIFTKKSILKALKSDLWVKKVVSQMTINLDSISNLKDFLITINKNGYSQFSANGFTILNYNKKTGKVAVRFVGSEYMGYNHNKHLQLGLILTPKKKYKTLFKKQVHFTMKTFKNGLQQ